MKRFYRDFVLFSSFPSQFRSLSSHLEIMQLMSNCEERSKIHEKFIIKLITKCHTHVTENVNSTPIEWARTRIYMCMCVCAKILLYIIWHVSNVSQTLKCIEKLYILCLNRRFLSGEEKSVDLVSMRVGLFCFVWFGYLWSYTLFMVVPSCIQICVE